MHAHPSVLVMLAERNENILRSIRNIPYIKVTHVSAVNVVELLKHDYLMLSPEAVTFLESTFDDGMPIPDETAEEK